MKSCGTLMRIFAIIAICVFSVTIIAEYALAVQSLADDREDFEEAWEEHKEAHEDGDYYGDEDDCDTCEDYEENDKYYDRRSISLVLSAVQSFFAEAIFAALVFIGGEIASKVGGVKKAAAAPAAPVPPVPPVVPAQVCPTCGTPKKGNENFCNICGRPF